MRALIIVIGLLIAVGLPEIPINGLVASRATMTGHLEREAFFWTVTAILIAYILVVEKRPLASIGLKRPTWKSLAFGIAAGVLQVAGFMVIFTAVMPALHARSRQAMHAGAFSCALSTCENSIGRRTSPATRVRRATAWARSDAGPRMVTGVHCFCLQGRETCASIGWDQLRRRR